MGRLFRRIKKHLETVMKKKKEGCIFEERRKHGGLYGFAEQQLIDELLKAQTDKTNPLFGVIEAFENNNHNEASRLLCTALENAMTEENSPLRIPAFVLGKLPAMDLALKEEMEKIRSGNETINSIRDLAFMQIQREADEQQWLVPKQQSQKKAEQGKQNITEERHAVIIKTIQDVISLAQTPIKGDSDLARRVRLRLCDLREKDLYIKDLFKKIPSPRNLRRIISENSLK